MFYIFCFKKPDKKSLTKKAKLFLSVFQMLFLFLKRHKVSVSNTIFVIFVIRKVFRSFTKKLREAVSTLSIGKTIGLIEF